MAEGHDGIASDFDRRASDYSRSHWHRACGEALVAHSSIASGDCVLDAGTGTGFAALAAAKRVAPGGRVVAVDISEGMLDRAREALAEADLDNVELLQADACDLSQFSSSSFDAVLCAAALLYMPVARALAEWHRLLKPGGTVGFSSMRVGFPRAGQLFRDCAAEFGVRLIDPSAELGSDSASHEALERSGFVDIFVIADHVSLPAADLSLAWESNLRSPAHAEVRSLGPADLERLRVRYEGALADRTSGSEVAEVLYAYGKTQGGVACA
jgi:ubiquinone/menaquinone biosynthesis C-methylase UbiE